MGAWETVRGWLLRWWSSSWGVSCDTPQRACTYISVILAVANSARRHCGHKSQYTTRNPGSGSVKLCDSLHTAVTAAVVGFTVSISMLCHVTFTLNPRSYVSYYREKSTKFADSATLDPKDGKDSIHDASDWIRYPHNALHDIPHTTGFQTRSQHICIRSHK